MLPTSYKIKVKTPAFTGIYKLIRCLDMKKKIAIVLLVAVLIIAAGFFYIKYHFLKAKDFKPVTSKARIVTGAFAFANASTSAEKS